MPAQDEDRTPARRAAQRAGGTDLNRLMPPRAYPAPTTADDELVAAVQLAGTRALVRATSLEEVTAVVATVVRDLGGSLLPARLAEDGAMQLDVSVGHGEPLLAWADPVSIAAMRIARVLPDVLEDARAIVDRLSGRSDRTAPASRATPGTQPTAPPAATAAARAEPFFRAVADVDNAGATRIVLDLLDSGVPVTRIVEDVLVPAQVRVGDLWERARWGVADEHAATAVTEAAVVALGSALPEPNGAGRHVVIACAEGEWHSLPARIAGLAARAAGARVTFLGGSVPARPLQRRLEAGDVSLLALSCTIPTNLVGAARSVQAAHDAGVPVVAGGRGFGFDERRALMIGADAYAADPAALTGTLPPLVHRLTDLPMEALLLDAIGASTLDVAHDRLVAAVPSLADASDAQQAGAREDLRRIARFTGAAVAVHDPTVLDEILTWLCRLPAGRLSPSVVMLSARLVADAIEPQAPAGAEMLREATSALQSRRDADAR